MKNSLIARRPLAAYLITRFFWAQHFFLLSVFLFSFALSSSAAAATTINVDQAYFIDTQAQFDIESVATAPFKNSNKKLNLGYKQGSIWIRLKITPSTDQSLSQVKPASETVIVRVGSHDLNTIELYESDAGKWQRQIAGDLLPKLETICTDDFYCFPLKGQVAKPQTIYVKIESPGFLTINTDAVLLTDLARVSNDRIRRTYSALTVAVGMLILGLFLLARYRSRLTHIYCWFQVSIFLYLVAIYGFLSDWFPGLSPAVLDTLPHLFFMMRTFFLILGVFVIIQPYCSSIYYERAILILLAMCLINCVLFLMGYQVFAMKSNLLIFTLHGNVQFFGLVKSTGVEKKVKSILLFAYICATLLLVAALVPWFFPDPTPGIRAPIQNLHDWRLNGFAVGLIVFLLVKSETEFREKTKNEELTALRLDKDRARANEALLADRNTLIDLITHDLKNPLGTIKFAATSLKDQLKDNLSALQRLKHIDLCVSRMNKLIEHVALSARVDRYEPTDLIHTQPVCELIDELTEIYPERDRFDIRVTEHAAITADREMLAVIFGNLIENAYKYSHSGSNINITVTCDNNPLSNAGSQPPTAGQGSEALCFEISNAVGVFGAPDDAHIFERYYRNPNSLIIPGMGLGLSLVQAAANKIGASVQFAHLANTVTFTVRIPA